CVPAGRQTSGRSLDPDSTAWLEPTAEHRWMSTTIVQRARWQPRGHVARAIIPRICARFLGWAAGANDLRIASTARPRMYSCVVTKALTIVMMGTLKAHFVDFNDAHEVVRTRDQEIPWTAARGQHGIVDFPR